MATPHDIVRIARTWLQTPFAHQGRQKGLRCDCIGLVIEVCREAGLIADAGLPATWDQQGYGRLPQSYGPLLPLLTYLQPVSRQAMQVGDVIVFQLVSGHPAHMGFLADGADPFSLIHAYNARTQRQAKVQEHRLAGMWLRCLHSAYRLPLDIPSNNAEDGPGTPITSGGD